ncbi:carboxymuconolactone decarboxylase family protein [Acidiferrimicrobium sp. IK]|uniref:carboxymuconolactone decarboxylase family protein n=1 Tax=Acidiferrimicrobium sp. IK TaxID=2871700 RepID=UPI0021CB3AE4|nr:carboxymuconolactone decarboxylase family protein [Acidiferrimicrobium sp. IK]MCU4185390.1 carboxymuconolactone decarboxylase family protein [Acidiferrimicrobium sp. IK]
MPEGTGPQTDTGGGRRLQPLRPEQLDGEQRAVYDAITSGPRTSGPAYFPLTDEAGRLHGPFDAMLRSPRVGGALQDLGAALRYGSALPTRLREIVILAVAAAEDSAFERFAHEAVGRGAGLTEGELDALRIGGPLPAEDRVEAMTLRAARALLRDGDLDEATYAGLDAELGERGLFELTALVGYYRLLALQLRVFRVPVPEGA